MRLMHWLPAPLVGSFPPVFSIWCGENGWDSLLTEVANNPDQIPQSASAVGTGLWGLQFAASGAVPPLKRFAEWVRSRGKIPIVEIPRNATQQIGKLGSVGGVVAVSPWEFPTTKPQMTSFFYDSPDPPDIPHNDSLSLPVPPANGVFPQTSQEISKELSYLSPEAKSVISIASLLVEEARRNNINVYLRGSAGGSALVCSIFGIPKHPKALFWRFYFPGRDSLPDIDIDTDQQEQVLRLLDSVCQRSGYKLYRLLTSDIKLSPGGSLILPREFRVPDLGNDSLGISISPFSVRMAEKGCKIDVLQSFSIGLLRVFGHTVEDMCNIALSPAPTPQTTVVIPQFRTRWGATIFDCFRQVSETITVDDVAWLLALMRPGISNYAGYVLTAKYGWNKAFKQIRYYPPKGKIFLFQEDLMRFIARQSGWSEADRIRRAITKGTPQQKEEAMKFLVKMGVDPMAASYTYCFSHAYLYAIVCMYFIHQLARHPREVFEFFYSNHALSPWEKEKIYQAAREQGFYIDKGEK